MHIWQRPEVERPIGADPKVIRAQEIIKELREAGAHGPFEVVTDDEGEIKVIDHGKRNRDGWAI
jgi:hypothetical protein